jgi:predicted GIY-YIG superfamily endonuclease
VSCLYFAVGRVKSWAMLKFGITKHDTPDRRVAAHSQSIYNPYGVRVREWRVPTFVTFGSLWEARSVETTLKAHFRKTLPRVWSDMQPGQMGIPEWRCVGSTPSGEWLVFPGTDVDTLLEFYGLALPPLQALAQDTTEGTKSLAELAYKAFAELAKMAALREWGRAAHIRTQPTPTLELRWCYE